MGGELVGSELAEGSGLQRESMASTAAGSPGAEASCGPRCFRGYGACHHARNVLPCKQLDMLVPSAQVHDGEGEAVSTPSESRIQLPAGNSSGLGHTAANVINQQSAHAVGLLGPPLRRRTHRGSSDAGAHLLPVQVRAVGWAFRVHDFLFAEEKRHANVAKLHAKCLRNLPSPLLAEVVTPAPTPNQQPQGAVQSAEAAMITSVRRTVSSCSRHGARWASQVVARAVQQGTRALLLAALHHCVQLAGTTNVDLGAKGVLTVTLKKCTNLEVGSAPHLAAQGASSARCGAAPTRGGLQPACHNALAAGLARHVCCDDPVRPQPQAHPHHRVPLRCVGAERAR